MRILVGISHPKQVYMFKNLIYEMKNKGYKIEVIVSEKEITSYLLRKFNIPFKIIGKNQPNVVRKLLNLPVLIIRTLLISLKFRPDIFIGQALPHIAYSSFLLNKPFIVFEDTEHSKKLHIIVMPFADAIITPSCYKKYMGRKQINFNGYYELAYLHPNCFKPDPEILNDCGLRKTENYIIMRFVSWQAHHDIGHKGLSLENKINAIREFSKYGRVFISSEKKLPDQLKEYELKVFPEQMHDLLYFSSLLYGESSTMASECAVLGTPSIFIDDVGRGYTDEEEEKYGLVFNYTESISDQKFSIDKGVELLKNDRIKHIWEKRRQKLLSEKIDVSAFMTWFVENYPKSKQVMKKNPNYQMRFK